MARRLFAVLIVAAAFFTWGVATGLYRGFPWPAIYTVGHEVAELLRSFGILQPHGPKPPEPPPALPDRVTGQIDSGLLNFDLTVLNAPSLAAGDGGGMALTDDGLLIAREPAGGVHFYSFKDDRISLLAFKLPDTNRDKLPARMDTGRKVDPTYMRYQDLEVFPEPDGPHLAGTLTHFDPDKMCFTSRLEEARLPGDWQTPLVEGAEAALLDWKILVEGTPCVPFANSRQPFGGNQAGGRIVRAPDGGLFVTTGDLEFDGIDSKTPAVSQEADSNYGRVLHVDPLTGVVQQWTMGQRNPQGMTFDDAGRLWTVEHGPMGGDELNLIQQGANYGWPNVTLGVLYTTHDSDAKYWPLSSAQGRHDGYVPPVFAWIPSIAPSSIIQVKDLDPRWEGDLLVGSLINRSLHRLRMNGTSVVYDEPIPMEQRIRDLAIANGRLYLLFDDGGVGIMVPHHMEDKDSWHPQTSTAILEAKCVQCHSNPSVPGLAGVFERDIASQKRTTYTDALKAVEGKWTAEALTQFLTDPQKFAPGTAMPNPGLLPEEISQVIEELKPLER